MITTEDGKIELTAEELALASGKAAPEATDDDQGTPEPDDTPTDADTDIIDADKAEKVEENADPTDVPEATETDTAPDKTGDETPDWRDEIKELAESYGLSDADLEDFEDADEFRRTAAILDRQLIASDKKTPDKKTEKQETAQVDEVELDPQAYIDAGHDEDVINLVKFTKKLQGELGALQETFSKSQATTRETAEAAAQAEADNYANTFHNAVDLMDEKRYGRSVVDNRDAELSVKCNANRRELYDAVGMIESHIASQAKAEGKQPHASSMKVLLQRAEQFVFGDELREQDRKTYQKKIYDQSRRRRGAAARTRDGNAQSADNPKPVDEVQEVLNDPRVAAKLREVEEAAGTE